MSLETIGILVGIILGAIIFGGGAGILANKFIGKKSAKKENFEDFKRYVLVQMTELRKELGLPVLTREQYDEIAQEGKLFGEYVYKHEDKKNKKNK